MSGLHELLLLCVVLTNFWVLGTTRLSSTIRATAIQGALLAALPIALHPGWSLHIIGLAAGTFLVKSRDPADLPDLGHPRGGGAARDRAADRLLGLARPRRGGGRALIRHRPAHPAAGVGQQSPDPGRPLDRDGRPPGADHPQQGPQPGRRLPRAGERHLCLRAESGRSGSRSWSSSASCWTSSWASSSWASWCSISIGRSIRWIPPG